MSTYTPIEASQRACQGPNHRGGLVSNTCVSAACMAWRWAGGKQERGYCGLAGRPESESD